MEPKEKMNLLFFIENIVSGLLAGLFSWLLFPNVNSWDLMENFLAGLMATSSFCGFFTGLASAFPVLIAEKRYKKASTYFVSGFVSAFATTALTSVAYSFVIEELQITGTNLPNSVIRFFWWFLLSLGLSCSFGYLHGTTKSLCKALMGITPAFIITGALVDKMLVNDPNYMFTFLLLGIMLGLGFSVSWEVLKESWLDEYAGHGITFRYFLDTEEFYAGSADENDLTLQEGPEILFSITEKDGVHIFELQNQYLKTQVNNSNFRYRTLTEGDKITIGDRDFIYHTTFSHSKNEMYQLS